MLRAEPRCAPEYAAVVHPDTFTRPERLEGPALLCVAARVGPARLIDNVMLTPTSRRVPVLQPDPSRAGDSQTPPSPPPRPRGSRR